ncbi:MBL fold metallo-hydrolase [Bacillus solitudinis]|uniref:MBL fold metallo-hydrolase n=1 Tax=Bacillus solitudinis TaxID=2014074 RepID=UPI000C24B659|nr:MBL fold metallo-hydrolase [Bacillus solitudinis]
MKVTVIGFWHGYPESGEATSGYLLEHENFKVLLDCGSGVLSKLQRYCSIDDIDAVVLSHYHGDHKADLSPFQYARIINANRNGQKVATVYGHQDDEQEFSKLSFLHVVKAVAFHDQAPLKVGPFQFTFQKTDHPVPCYAMKIQLEGKTLVYTADSRYIKELESFASHCDVLISECSGYAEDNVAEFGHMNSVDAGKLAAAANAKTLVLSHLPHYGKHELLRNEASSIYSGNIHIAKTGLVLEL